MAPSASNNTEYQVHEKADPASDSIGTSSNVFDVNPTTQVCGNNHVAMQGWLRLQGATRSYKDQTAPFSFTAETASD